MIEIDCKTPEIRVQNDGTSISKAKVHKIAEPFFVTKRERGGAGTGLLISSEILAQFGG